MIGDPYTRVTNPIALGDRLTGNAYTNTSRVSENFMKAGADVNLQFKRPIVATITKLDSGDYLIKKKHKEAFTLKANDNLFVQTYPLIREKRVVKNPPAVKRLIFTACEKNSLIPVLIALTPEDLLEKLDGFEQTNGKSQLVMYTYKKSNRVTRSEVKQMCIESC